MFSLTAAGQLPVMAPRYGTEATDLHRSFHKLFWCLCVFQLRCAARTVADPRRKVPAGCLVRNRRDELDLLPFCFSSCWPYSFGLHDREVIAPGTSLEVRVPYLQVQRPGVLIVFDARDRIAVALLSHGCQNHGSPPGLSVIIYLFHGASVQNQSVV